MRTILLPIVVMATALLLPKTWMCIVQFIAGACLLTVSIICRPSRKDRALNGGNETLSLCLAMGLALLGVSLCVVRQEPKFWWDKQWAGVAFYKGGYRSWSMSFCDGFLPVYTTNGKFELKPVVIETNGLRLGYHRFPKFSHVDARANWPVSTNKANR